MTDFNPYQKPQAPAPGRKPPPPAHAPVKCSAGRGVGWIGDAWQILTRNMLFWIGGLLVLSFVSMAAGSVPFVGYFVGVVLGPMIYAGIYVVAQKSDRGEVLSFEDFFAGFQQRTVELARLGAACLVMQTVVMLVTGIIAWSLLHDDFQMFSQLLTTDVKDMPPVSPMLFLKFMLVLALYLVLLFPYLAAVWFAVPLVVLHEEVSVRQAIRWSFAACMKNVGSLTVYGLVLLVLVIAGMLPFMLGLLVVAEQEKNSYQKETGETKDRISSSVSDNMNNGKD